MMGVDSRAKHLHGNKLINLFVFGPDSSIYKYDGWHVWLNLPHSHNHFFYYEKILIRLVSFKIIMCNYSRQEKERRNKSENREKIVGKIGFHYRQCTVPRLKLLWHGKHTI